MVTNLAKRILELQNQRMSEYAEHVEKKERKSTETNYGLLTSFDLVLKTGIFFSV